MTKWIVYSIGIVILYITLTVVHGGDDVGIKIGVTVGAKMAQERTLILRRNCINGDGTFGVLIDGEHPFALTLEDEWKDNRKGESSIPVGTYTCKKRKYYRRGYMTFEVMDVPNRTNILIHVGNTEDDTKGCILVGEEFGRLKGKDSILSSGRGFKEFMDRFGEEDKFTLKIEKVC